MKIWSDFLDKFPNEQYCLIFEDDFVSNAHSKMILNKAVEFMKQNSDNINLLYLHDICVSVQSNLNNNSFTKGWGICNQAYFINRKYIQNIIDKNGSLPIPRGKHLDFEININKFDKDNVLYTENIYFTVRECFKQIVSKSDNTVDLQNMWDNVIDINQRCESIKKIFNLIKHFQICNDDKLKTFSYIMGEINNESIKTGILNINLNPFSQVQSGVFTPFLI